jgi:hypothetical protein
MEALIYLAVGIDKIRIVCSEQVVDAEINIDACLRVFVLQEGYFDCRHITKCAIFGNLFDDRSALSNKLVLVVSHPVVKNNYNVDVAACRP